MLDPPGVPLRIVDGTTLPERLRRSLRPGEPVPDAKGVERRLPRYFYEIPTWDRAMEIRLTADFGLWEFIDVDVREEETLRRFPRYVPLAITLLAGQLQLLRSAIGRVVRISANGGYRSPGHRVSSPASTHCWGTAANIYRIGEEWLDSPESIERHRRNARSILTGVWTRPAGRTRGTAFDHLHLDLGYCTLEPHGRCTASALHDSSRGGGVD